MNTSERNNTLFNRPPIDELVIKTARHLAIDPKKAPRKILTHSNTEEKIEEKYFLLKGKPKLLAQKNQIQNEILQSKALEPLINEKKIINRIKSESNEERTETKSSKKKASKNFYLDGDLYTKDAVTNSKSNTGNFSHADNLPTPSNMLKKTNYMKEEETLGDISKSDEGCKNQMNFQNFSSNSDSLSIGSKSKFGKERKFFDNFEPDYKPYQIILEESRDDHEHEHVHEDISNLPTSTSKAKIRNPHFITNSGCQSKIKSYFKDSKNRGNSNKSKNKIASKRKQDELTLSEQEQLKVSQKKKKNIR